LEKEAIIEGRTTVDRRSTEYGLTDAGRDLVKVINAVGDWGVRWLIPNVRPWGSTQTD
jgi:DNA-binding HxlR family transcriptional regulator